jgi:hypothetical protein
LPPDKVVRRFADPGATLDEEDMEEIEQANG